MLVVSSLINELNEIFDPDSFYICTRIMIVPSVKIFTCAYKSPADLAEVQIQIPGVGRGLRVCIYNILPGDTHAAGLWVPLKCSSIVMIHFKIPQ